MASAQNSSSTRGLLPTNPECERCPETPVLGVPRHHIGAPSLTQCEPFGAGDRRARDAAGSAREGHAITSGPPEPITRGIQPALASKVVQAASHCTSGRGSCRRRLGPSRSALGRDCWRLPRAEHHRGGCIAGARGIASPNCGFRPGAGEGVSCPIPRPGRARCVRATR
jgi:hypothetical protein